MIKRGNCERKKERGALANVFQESERTSETASPHKATTSFLERDGEQRTDYTVHSKPVLSYNNSFAQQVLPFRMKQLKRSIG